MEALFSDVFVKSLKKHTSIKKIIQKKVDMIMENPVALGEPLRGNFRGYYSCSVKKNFIVIYLYCKVCRVKDDDKIVCCQDCKKCTDETIKFVDVGPHDKAYEKKSSYWA
jgi:mRNA-degrading endonuclease YafQ of YafQ-DinJ toxin-antitoxin module